MFLKEGKSGELVEVLAVQQLFDPFQDSIVARFNAGEELPESDNFKKASLVFCSGEALPRCWLDPHFRDDELIH